MSGNCQARLHLFQGLGLRVRHAGANSTHTDPPRPGWPSVWQGFANTLGKSNGHQWAANRSFQNTRGRPNSAFGSTHVCESPLTVVSCTPQTWNLAIAAACLQCLVVQAESLNFWGCIGRMENKMETTTYIGVIYLNYLGAIYKPLVYYIGLYRNYLVYTGP